MKKLIKEHKIVSGFIGSLFLLIIGWQVLWGTWVTNQIFNLKQGEALAANDTKVVVKSVEEVKESVQSIDKKIEDQNKTMKEDQKEVFKLLLDIQRQIKDNNKK